ncbi:hypothetical protein GGX14DRAFT_569461 [Mycena pura]|uniref:Uncharacterized protein n=1 Tax=Mycena pura TaxID=153505 RepID=A0AAD6VAD1_9AGAR|nr:hypothetical protein GGX14DRAFT_569461 [Mycena pura]
MLPESKTLVLAAFGLVLYLAPIVLCIWRPVLLATTPCESLQCQTFDTSFTLIVAVTSICATSIAIFIGAFEDGFIDAIGLASGATATAYGILQRLPTLPILVFIFVVSCGLVILLRIILKASVPADPLFGFIVGFVAKLKVSHIVHMLGTLAIGAAALLGAVGAMFMRCPGAERVDGEDMGAASIEGNVDSGGDKGPVRASGESDLSKWSLFNAVSPPVPPPYSPLPQSALGKIKHNHILPV